MESNKPSCGLRSVLDGDNPSQRSHLWRPWIKNEGITNQQTTSLRDFSNAQPKIQQVIHPVKLFWPKSRCFDYLYQDAERLLRSYPVQATICPYDDSSSEEADEEDDEEEEKKPN